MALARALDGLDGRPWSRLSHAYGSAEDLPDLLRALAGADEAAADEALSELYGSVLHQGTVYSATAEVIPFLARIAAAGHRKVDVLALLGGMAESDDEYGVPPGTVRAAAAEQLPQLLPLLDDPHPAVRQAAGWALSHTRTAEAVLPALRARWGQESDALVRAEVLAGISRLYRSLGAAIATSVLDPAEPAQVRLAAVLACLDADVPWTGIHTRTMLSLLPADPLVADRFDPERNEPLAAVTETLLGRGGDADREAVFALVDSALRDDRTEVRSEGLWAAERACMLSRSAPERLLPALVATAVDEEAVVSVASLLGHLGTVAAQAAPVLAPLAGRNPGQEDDYADRALAALVLIAPEEAAPLLARALERRPRALDAAAGFRAPADAAFPYDDDLLDAVRHRLSHPEALHGNEPWQLTALVMGWGGRAAAALPQLYAALPHHPDQTARAITAIAADCGTDERREAARELRAAAENGSLPAAKALYDLTGEEQHLLRCLAQTLEGPLHQRTQAAAIAATLGAQAVNLIPVLRAALTEPDGDTTTPALDADTALAAALWHITQDADTVAPILDSVFARAAQNPWSQWSVARAAQATALLGPAGRSLTSHLESAFTHPVAVPAAATALVAVAGTGTLDRTSLATAVLDAAEEEADPMGACDALGALGPAALSAAQVQRLAVLAEGDARVIRSGLETQIISRDEAFRTRARALLAAATDHPTD
ncbi:HEAT repeat domain-containing protein [Streptomyces sp. NPDC006326]|uniref:HEAT repeat domain-containing protein n=1 Tax=Streptomyces sp. NPDC006326 TaxID=3156752 RepID=UPI0033B73D0C